MSTSWPHMPAMALRLCGATTATRCRLNLLVSRIRQLSCELSRAACGGSYVVRVHGGDVLASMRVRHGGMRWG